MTGEFPTQRASDAENVSIWWRHHDFVECAATVTTMMNSMPTADWLVDAMWHQLTNQLCALTLPMLIPRDNSTVSHTRSAAPTQCSLQWRHHDHDGVSIHQPHGCFIQSFIQTQIKENIKAPRHWSLCGEFTGDRTRASYAESVSIWWRHHVMTLTKAFSEFSSQLIGSGNGFSTEHMTVH